MVHLRHFYFGSNQQLSLCMLIWVEIHAFYCELSQLLVAAEVKDPRRETTIFLSQYSFFLYTHINIALTPHKRSFFLQQMEDTTEIYNCP